MPDIVMAYADIVMVGARLEAAKWLRGCQIARPRQRSQGAVAGQAKVIAARIQSSIKLTNWCQVGGRALSLNHAPTRSVSFSNEAPLGECRAGAMFISMI
jgi:hypothetical protein